MQKRNRQILDYLGIVGWGRTMREREREKLIPEAGKVLLQRLLPWQAVYWHRLRSRKTG